MSDTRLAREKGGLLGSLFGKGAFAAALATFVLAVAPFASANPSEIYASDACSPSFNVALMDPNACTRNGGMPFDAFIALLGQNKRVGAWHFSAPRVNVSAGSSLTVENRGGEAQTLTQVTQFGGGGIVAPIDEDIFGP